MQLAWMTDLHLNFLSPAERLQFMETVRDRADAFVITGDIALNLEKHTPSVPKTGCLILKSGFGWRFLIAENGPRSANLRTKPVIVSKKSPYDGTCVCVHGTLFYRGAAIRKSACNCPKVEQSPSDGYHRCQVFPGRV